MHSCYALNSCTLNVCNSNPTVENLHILNFINDFGTSNKYFFQKFDKTKNKFNLCRNRSCTSVLINLDGEKLFLQSHILSTAGDLHQHSVCDPVLDGNLGCGSSI
jgi:hypothetical protein